MRKYLLAALAVGLIGADNKEDAVKKEMKKQEGDWVLVSSFSDGKKLPAEVVKAMRRTIKGNKFTVTRMGETVASGTFTVDPTKKPKTIDVKRATGPDKDKPMLGIYELDGDNYKVCFAPPGKERPTKFFSKAGTGHVLSVWKRANK
jgi:uncharacterized protein (TIGR03067 family)